MLVMVSYNISQRGVIENIEVIYFPIYSRPSLLALTRCACVSGRHRLFRDLLLSRIQTDSLPSLGFRFAEADRTETERARLGLRHHYVG